MCGRVFCESLQIAMSQAPIPNALHSCSRDRHDIDTRVYKLASAYVISIRIPQLLPVSWLELHPRPRSIISPSFHLLVPWKKPERNSLNTDSSETEEVALQSVQRPDRNPLQRHTWWRAYQWTHRKPAHRTSHGTTHVKAVTVS